MTTTAIKLVFDSTLSIPSPSLAETPEKISDTILRFVVSHSFCLIGQASLESILAINISTGDCIRLSITFDASTSTVLLAAKGFVARILQVDLSHLTELDLSNKVLSLPMQAKRMAIPGLRASLDVLALPSLVPATMHSVFIKQVPLPSLLERNNAKNGSTILTDIQHKEKLHLLSIVSQNSNQILDYARVCVSRSKLKQAMQSARESRRMHEDDKGNCDSYFDDDGYGYNADSDEDDETEDGPTTIIPLACLVRDVVVLRSSTRQRGKLISEKIIQEITEHCKLFGWSVFQEIQQVKETTSLEILDEAVTIPSLLPTQLLQQPLRSSTQSLLQDPKLKLPLPGNGWPSGETSSSGFMSALTVAKFQRAERNNVAVSSAASETSLKNLKDECKPKKSWLSMRSRELESKSSSSPSSSSSSSIIERFLFNLHSLSWLSHRNESAASSKQLEAICSALLGCESAADTFDDELLSSSLSSSSSTAALAAREPKQLSIRFQTADDAAREKDDREGKEMTYGGPGIMDADSSNTTAAERNKLLASMNLSIGVDTAEVGGGGGGAVTSDAIAGKKKPTAKRKAPSAKSSTKSSKIAKIITDGATEQGGEAASSEPMTAVVAAVVKDLVALASAVTQIVTEANGDKVALEKELTSKRVTLDQLKAYAKTEAKVAISGAKAVLVARILAKIMP